jgi:molybdopterin converting factor subunit 1
MNGAAEDDQKQNEQISVRVLFFGAARDVVGQSEGYLALSSPANATMAFEKVLSTYPDLRRFGRSLLLAVNQEYAPADSEIREGDELAVLPPVSGGSGEDTEREGRGGGGATADAEVAVAAKRQDAEWRRNRDLTGENSCADFFELTTEPLNVGAISRSVVLPQCGATVTLDGYAREWTKGRRTLYLIYEAYAPMALSEMRRLGREAHKRFDIAHIGIVHRTGRLAIGDTSVVIAVSAPHRRAAFEACEWAIRELKCTVPIWKKEVFEDGQVWAEGEAVPKKGTEQGTEVSEEH